MNETNAMKGREAGEMSSADTTEATLLPPVDIYEDAAGITIEADLPGVSRERLSIQVDTDTLTIEGEAAIEMPEGMQALYADLRSTGFRRSFTLSRELQADKITAQMKDGVLTLRVPKRAEAQPRKIEISVG
ncbi:molecular chaperone (small heat shock protein) [Thioflavicoccus mobilis 8321]|uniref:Molecular chaperone (Small heat shock protein) n=1 Tax=Thioflavicoccus mobilis 8321 TaxID=765912 RepID=L0H2J1_9GAMM|nr:Hsp20/alpha crystallin family protein [Thioflavicoccus mobilis]AGA92272.1 molecular chaperone (small heat shock protein) [Thioflavicoccus mobilis 8321]